MDCGACAIKIENALKRLPGVSAIDINYSTEMLSLDLDADRTPQDTIDKRIRSLGYTPFPLDGDEAAGRPGLAREDDGEAQAWWQSRKGRLVIATGSLLGAAFVLAHLIPALSLWIYVTAAVVGLLPFARRAMTSAISGTPFSIEMLMSVAAIGAMAIGAAEEAAVVVFLFAVGELLENVAAGRAREGIKALMSVVPRIAQLERNGSIIETSIDQLHVGDIVVVRPGDRVPSDGEVIEGTSDVDEAPVTGESVPVSRTVGDTVYAGSINVNAVLRLKITRTAADNTISRIIHLVEEAQGSKAPTARLIDRFSAYYTPAAMAVAAAVIVLPPVLLSADWTTWIYRGLAILLIACPCALVISTPAAIASALSAGARRGLLIKGGAALETLGHIATAAFDKTGTLTHGKLRITDVIVMQGSEDELVAKAAAVERGSSHPLAQAITSEAERRRIASPPSFGAVAIPGKAVRARLRDGFVSVGSPRYAAEITPLSAEAVHDVERLEGEGKTVVLVLFDKAVAGIIALRDEPREDAAAAVARLKTFGVSTVMLTGDNRRTGAAIAEAIGIDVKAELLPDAKLDAIAEMKARGPVAMIGDGINDAPALAAASVGIAMGGGTDVALETADAALLQNRVHGVADLIELSRATLGNIRQNIAIAFGLKLVFLVTTVTGSTLLWMAILADTGATVLVTANALRLLRFRSGKQP